MGAGDDSLTSNLSNLHQNDNINALGGTDTLILTGGTASDWLGIDASDSNNQIDIVGSTLTNFERFDLSGFLGTVSFNGLNGNNRVKSGASNDDLTASDGNDYLDGGTGADQLTGGKGNDTYIVDNINDLVIEGFKGGTDTIQSSVTFTLASLTNIENLTLIGGSAINGTGNNLANTITGNSANNSLTGNAGNDTLNGGDGNDTLIGGAGINILIGGTGDDLYIVDTITEQAGEGTDTVQSSVTFTLATLTNIENLTLTGSNAINGTGNAGNNVITGNSGNNILQGSAGNDSLYGGQGNDTLQGKMAMQGNMITLMVAQEATHSFSVALLGSATMTD
jgi:Ca2+-binding RTX toxin-like protein